MGEQELAERCRLGDNKARQLLYERYADRLFAVCLRYAGSRELAEDLLHDGFLKIFESMDKFAWRGEGSLRAWLERVAVNTVLQYFRRHDVLQQSVELDHAPEAYDEPDACAMESVPAKQLMQFVAQLPVGYRTVFNLYVLEGKSHKEIAQLLGIQERSSASQLARAKTALAARITEWMKDNA